MNGCQPLNGGGLQVYSFTLGKRAQDDQHVSQLVTEVPSGLLSVSKCSLDNHAADLACLLCEDEGDVFGRCAGK